MQDLKADAGKQDHAVEFSLLLDRIVESEWKKALNQALKTFNIKLFNIDKLSPRKVRELYQHLSDRFYRTGRESEAWHENELRLYVWVLVTYSYLQKRPISEFASDHWNYLSRLFHGKNPLLCEFQFMNIRKAALKNEPWSLDEDSLLVRIINVQKERNRWNQVAKFHFYESHKRYFRTAKQCRQRWNNYLDPSKTRGSWSENQDLILINCVVTEGKKWALIAKQLDGRRTEHMVKNRFKSLMTRFSKNFKERRFVTELDVLDLIVKKFTDEGKLTLKYPKLDEEPVKLEESESELPIHPQPPSFISPSIESTQQADLDGELPKTVPSPLLPPLLYDLESDHIQYLNPSEMQLVDDRCDFIDRGFGHSDHGYFDDDHTFV